MLGKVKEFIVESSTADEDILSELGDGVISALELKSESDCTVEVNGESFEVKSSEVLSFPYNYMRINSLSIGTAGARVKIRYLAE